VKNYFRYADDFVIIHQDEGYLNEILYVVDDFLETELGLQLHPDKVSIEKFHRGIDFLGYVVFPYHTVLRTTTKKRMLRKISKKYHDLKNGLIDEKSFNASLQSYLGILKHCRGHKIQKEIKDLLK